MVLAAADAGPRPEDQQAAEPEEPGLEGDHGGDAEGGMRPARLRERDHERDEADGGEDEADRLPPPDADAEDPVGHHGDQHDAAGENDLHGAHRREGERGDVKDEGGECDDHPDREPLLREERLAAAQRVPHVDRTGLARSLVLQEEADVGDDGAQEREQDAEFKSHR